MKTITTCLLALISLCTSAQQYITTGTIEYEVRVNNKKSIPPGEWGDMIRDQVPEFSTRYFNFAFDETQSYCNYSRTTDTKPFTSFFGKIEDNVWYNNYSSGQSINFVSIDNEYLLSRDLPKLKWKLYPNDQRIIAGFNCRKASTVIADSVYVFAYYTDEIITPGGPMGLNGLPGMILGVTIPRLYESWVATKLELGLKKPITAPSKGKKYTVKDITNKLDELSKSWGSDGKKYIAPVLWRLAL